jgi:hypothetical protein
MAKTEIPPIAIDLDGGTDIGAAIVDADLFLIDDGAGGTMRKTAASRLKTYTDSKKILQVVSTTKTDVFTTTSTSMTDITGLSVDITPASSSNTILVLVTIQGSQDIGANRVSAQLLRDSTAIAVGASVGSRSQASVGLTSAHADLIGSAATSTVDSPSTTSEITYKMQVAVTAGSGSAYINQTENDGDSSGYPRYASTITAMEIGA